MAGATVPLGGQSLAQLRDFINNHPPKMVASLLRASGEVNKPSALVSQVVAKKGSKPGSKEALKNFSAYVQKLSAADLAELKSKLENLRSQGVLTGDEVNQLMDVASKVSGKASPSEITGKILAAVDHYAANKNNEQLVPAERLLSTAVFNELNPVLKTEGGLYAVLGMNKSIQGAVAEVSSPASMTVTQTPQDPAAEKGSVNLKPEIAYDENGNPVDKNGNPLELDEQGNPIAPMTLAGQAGQEKVTGVLNPAGSSSGASSDFAPMPAQDSSAPALAQHGFTITAPTEKPSEQVAQNIEGASKMKAPKAVSVTPPPAPPSKNQNNQRASSADSTQTPISGRGLAANEQPRQQQVSNADPYAAERELQQRYAPDSGLSPENASNDPVTRALMDTINSRPGNAGRPIDLSTVLGQVLPKPNSNKNGGVFHFDPPQGIELANNGLLCDSRGHPCHKVRSAQDFCTDLASGGEVAKQARQELMRLILNEARNIQKIPSGAVKAYYGKLDSILAPAPASEKANADTLKAWLQGRNESGMARINACEPGGAYPLWSPSGGTRATNLKESWCYNLQQRTQMNNDVVWKNGEWVYGDRVMQVVYGCKNGAGAKVIADLVSNPLLRQAAGQCNVPESHMDPLQIRNLRDTAVTSKSPYTALDQIAAKLENANYAHWDKPISKNASPISGAELSTELARLTGESVPAVDCKTVNAYMKFAHNAAVNPRFPEKLLSPIPSNKPQMYYADSVSSSGHRDGEQVQEVYSERPLRVQPIRIEANAYGKVVLPSKPFVIEALKATQESFEGPTVQKLMFKGGDGKDHGVDVTLDPVAKPKN